MKVEIKDLDKQLRLAGRFGKTFASYTPEKLEKLKNQSTKKSKKRYSKKNNIFIDRQDGSKLRMLIKRSLKPDNNKSVPAILWIHGGGLATGTPESCNYMLGSKFLKNNEYVLIAPDYRLSVEAPYPAALEDCYAALLWVKKHAEKLGINDDQIFVGGESAGAGLTAALCMYARDKKEVNIAFQMPLFPMLDDRCNTPSMIDNNAPIWDVALNKTAWKIYLEGVGDEVPQYAAPARETDYSNLPPAATFVGSVDSFRDETVQYMEHLKDVGIPAYYRVFDGVFHGSYVMAPWAKVSKEQRNFIQDAFTYACEHYYAKQN